MTCKGDGGGDLSADRWTILWYNQLPGQLTFLSFRNR